MRGLYLHCGASRVEREDVNEVETPLSTSTWCPISHDRLIDGVIGELGNSGMSVVEEAHSLSHGGNRYFGLFQVQNGASDNDYGVVVGIRNSHDKKFPAGIVVGSRVFVCDNLAFSGEIRLSRKHTRFINRDLPELINVAIGKMGDQREFQSRRISEYKEFEVNNSRAHDIVIRAMDSKIITSRSIRRVVREWRNPRHEQFRDRTAWSLFNAFTEVQKSVRLESRVKRTQALHGLLDREVGVSREQYCLNQQEQPVQ